ncbi:hypothetical protein [Streptomyces sp. CNQ085]|uniref:hypothetical protein n=1 Tax=Streptomyces sp. CNQ085 TaxID=2886944 RepID=UPI001F50C91B|nr:hypothetical protein [Streptomyces sp. CNQ085]MCI0386208.1 hypothetical protein [Streptomyces sp. CNQ085]
MQEHVGEGRPLTVRAFAERARDPKSGRRLSKSLVGNLVAGHQIKIDRDVVAAIAIGLGVPRRVVQAAAAEQYLGLTLDDPFDTDPGDTDAVVRVAHQPDADGDMPATREFIERARTRDQ